jgi:CheY-like chemotaxis protein
VTAIPSPSPIIIVEDDPFDVILLTNVLTSADIANPVIAFGNGAEAIDFLRRVVNDAGSTVPAALVLDLHLPQVDGFGVIAWVRRQPILADLKVIVLAGTREPDEVQRAVALGANEFLLKPADPVTLRELLITPRTARR